MTKGRVKYPIKNFRERHILTEVLTLNINLTDIDKWKVVALEELLKVRLAIQTIMA